MIHRCASRIAVDCFTALLLLACCTVAYGADNLYVFVFKNGQALQNVVVKVGEVKKSTSEYGLANFDLPAGEYEIGYFKNGELFALTDVKLLAEQQSQVFLTLTQEGEKLELDLPLAAYLQRVEQNEIKQQTGPRGTLRLTVLDAKTKKPVSGAKLFFKGYAVEAESDKNGVAELPLSEADYDISVVHPKYVMKVIKDVNIKADAVHQEQVSLIKADIILEEFVVTAPSVEGSLASTFTQLRESSVIGEAVSSEEFTKSGDASAADALKRVTGITIVNGKYVYVRGLGERYSVVMLNDLYVPTPEPTKRVVPLDIFPSSVVQSMNIQKTYSADLPGTFGGGDVLITSKDIPEEDNYIKFGMSTSYNDSTGKEVYTNSDNVKGLPGDVITKSANFQSLQEGFPAIGVPGYTPEELKALDSAIVNYRTYNLQKSTLKPGYKLALDAGQSFRNSLGVKYGFVGSVYTSIDEKNIEAVHYSTFYNEDTGVLAQSVRSDYQQTKLRDRWGGLLSFSVNNNGDKFTYTYLNIDDKANTTTYSEKDAGQVGLSQDDQHRIYYEYKKKTISAHQLRGEHHIDFKRLSFGWFDDFKLNWSIERANATRFEPGSVEYSFLKMSDSLDFQLDQKIWFLYSDLKDELDNYRVDLSLPFTHNTQDNYLAIGWFRFEKNRTLDNRRFKVQHTLYDGDIFKNIDDVFTQQHVDNGDLHLTDNYRPNDAYTAKQDVTATYIKQLYSITKDLDLLAGVRMETSRQQLIDTQSNEPYKPLETDDTLTSLSFNYSLTADQKIRLGYANTLSRPDFREFSKNRYKDPVTEDIIFGYEFLKYTTIKSMDLKYEWYISYDEVFSTGVFLKDFTNPVETIRIPDPNSQYDTKMVSYRNALGATSRGFEISFRKKLGVLGPSYSNFFVASNFAWINSRIRIDRDQSDEFLRDLTSTDRPMQGQSPYVVNFNIGYDNLNTGRSAVLLYNEFGKRIIALGTQGAPDNYEYPFRKLDFVVKWRLNDTYDEQVKKIGYNLDFKLSNILDATAERRQGDTVVYESYRPGRSLSLSFSMKY